MQVLTATDKDLGGFSVRRLLPQQARRSVGPFVFFDHIGPAELPPGTGITVRPHPHIGLATVTFLFDGSFVHRDSLGVVQPISPGDVNWMVAGRGVVHSERTAPDVLAAGQKLHGIQTWYALPAALEECAPSFAHHPKDTLPRLVLPGAQGVVVLGTAFGLTSPVDVPVPTLYAMLDLEAGATVTLDAEHDERAIFVLEGDVRSDGEPVPLQTLAVIDDANRGDVVLSAGGPARVALVGGARLDGPRHLLWNFVSSRKERLQEAVADWQQRRFPLIETDAEEFIPYP